MSQFVTTTTLSQMRSLGSPAERSLQRLEVVLASEFPGGTGFDLAEPVPRKDGSGIDWYTEHDDELVRLADLPPEQAAPYRARLRNAVVAVLGVASSREASGDTAARSTANALRNAVTFPGEENVWIARGGAPAQGAIILTAWGYEKHDAVTSGRGEIVGAARDRLPPGMPVRDEPEGPAAVPAAPATMAVVAPAERPWWRSLLGLLLIVIPIALALFIAWLLLPACGIRLPFGNIVFGEGDGAYCQLAAPEAPPPPAASDRTQDLMAEIAVLEEQLRQQLNSCRPSPTPITQPEPAPEPVPPVTEPPPVDVPPEAERGNLEITLAWDDINDLDLYIDCPGGLIFHRQKQACGGKLDVDKNSSIDTSSSTPAEHAFWPDPPSGKYRVTVTYYGQKDSAATSPFRVHIDRVGQPRETYEGAATIKGNNYFVVEFEVP